VENYRSTEAIIDVFTTLIQNNKRRLGQKHLRRAISSTSHGPGHVILMHFPTDADERLWVVEKIRALLEPSAGGSTKPPTRKPGDIAILCRSLKHVTALVSDLRAAGFAVEVVGETGLFGDAVVGETLAWLFTLDNPLEDEISLHRVLRFHGFGLSYADQHAVSQAAKQAGKPLMVLIEELGKNPSAAIDGLSERGRDLLGRFAELLEHFRIETQAQSSPDLVETVHRVARCAGLHAFLDPDTPAGRRHLNAFRGLLDLAQQYQNYYPNPSLHGFVGFLKLLEGLGHDETAGEPSEDPGSIKVMTVHQAKGREFPVVFVGGLSDRFPSPNRRDKHRKFLDFLTLNGQDPSEVHVEEERRVLYVALSRAKEELILSCYDCRGESRRQKTSRFLEEIEQSSAVQKTRHEGYPGSTAQAGAVPQASGKTVEDALFHLVSWVGRQSGRDDVLQYFKKVLGLLGGLMADRVGEQQVRQALAALGLPGDLEICLPQPDKPVAPKGTLRLMPTSLELYRKCPRQYYYKHVAEIPEPERRAARFGTAVHKALERLHRKHPRLSVQLRDELLQYFEEELQAVSFYSEQEKKQAIDLGKEVLTRFLDEEAAFAPRIQNTEVEKDFRLCLENDILLSMRMDRLDTLRDGSVRVLDYKTGKVESGPEYLRQFQMPCYALAVHEEVQKPLSYIEVVGLKKLDDKGNTLRKRLEWDNNGSDRKLSPKRLDQLRQEIQEIAAAIRAGQFEAKPDEDTCRYCSYRRLCDKAAV
jgi:DNA helicase-2/ATP-dependent DNA helicase PcrA